MIGTNIIFILSTREPLLLRTNHKLCKPFVDI